MFADNSRKLSLGPAFIFIPVPFLHLLEASILGDGNPRSKRSLSEAATLAISAEYWDSSPRDEDV